MYNWIQSEKFKGVRWHQHPTRKHGIQFDRLFGIRYQLGGKRFESVLGWASEGYTETGAALEIAKFKKAYQEGRGEISISEKRRKGQEERKAHELAQLEAQRREISVHTFWENHYWPAQTHKAKGSLVAESCLYQTWIQPAVGGKALVALAPDDLERIKARMVAEGKAPSSIKYAFAVISQVWNLAKRHSLVSGDNPTKAVSLPKRDNRRERFLTTDEAGKLLVQLKRQSPQTHDMALLALHCGLRFGEIASLDWSCVDFSEGTLSIRDPKSRTNRVAFMTSAVSDMLTAHRLLACAEHGKATGLVFRSRTGERIASVSHSFTRLADRLFNEGISDPRQKVCFHTLRHTFASWLVQRNVDLYSVKELMGHASFKMTQRYSHLSPDGLRKAAAAIELMPDNH